MKIKNDIKKFQFSFDKRTKQLKSDNQFRIILQQTRRTKTKLPVEGRGAKLLKTNMAATTLRSLAAEDL